MRGDAGHRAVSVRRRDLAHHATADRHSPPPRIRDHPHLVAERDLGAQADRRQRRALDEQEGQVRVGARGEELGPRAAGAAGHRAGDLLRRGRLHQVPRRDHPAPHGRRVGGHHHARAGPPDPALALGTQLDGRGEQPLQERPPRSRAAGGRAAPRRQGGERHQRGGPKEAPAAPRLGRARDRGSELPRDGDHVDPSLILYHAARVTFARLRPLSEVSPWPPRHRQRRPRWAATTSAS